MVFRGCRGQMIEYDHQSWLRIALSMRGTIVPRTLVRVAVAGSIGAMAVYADLAFSPLPHAIAGVALALLLVARVHASHARWTEARASLGRLVAACRDLARQLAAYPAEDGESTKVRGEIGRYVGAYYRLLVQGLRREDELGELQRRLSEMERAELGELSRGRELAILTWISARLARLHREGAIGGEMVRAMDANVTAMVQEQSSCERLARTPLPLPWAQHATVCLVVFCWTLPFAMVDVVHGWTPLAAALVAFVIVGIDQIAVELEAPFARGPAELPLDELGDIVDDAMRRALLHSDVVLQPPGEEMDELFVAMA